jgi:hypothetical protein
LIGEESWPEMPVRDGVSQLPLAVAGMLTTIFRQCS